jgi:hypothetical protein
MLETGRKRAQLRQLVALHRGDPGVEAVTAPASHELGERRDMAGERLQVRAAGQHLLAFELLVCVQAVRMAQQPCGDVTDLRRWRCGWWRAELAEGA